MLPLYGKVGAVITQQSPGPSDERRQDVRPEMRARKDGVRCVG